MQTLKSYLSHWSIDENRLAYIPMLIVQPATMDHRAAVYPNLDPSTKNCNRRHSCRHRHSRLKFDSDLPRFALDVTHKPQTIYIFFEKININKKAKELYYKHKPLPE